MPRTRPPYPPEFRAEAVELIRSGAKSIRGLSRDLGVSDQTVRNWLRQDDLDAGRRTDGLTTAEREELRRLCSAAAYSASSTTVCSNAPAEIQRPSVNAAPLSAVFRPPGAACSSAST